MTQDSFQITDRALAKIAKLLESEPAGAQNTRLRVSVLGGGCAGFRYEYSFDSGKTDTDTIFGVHGAEVLVDDISVGLLKESTLDYIEDLGSAGFEIKNPNATAKCGCGNSFSI